MVLLISYKFCKPPLTYLQDYFFQCASLLIHLFFHFQIKSNWDESLFFHLANLRPTLNFLQHATYETVPCFSSPVTATPTRPSATWRHRLPAATDLSNTSRRLTCTSLTCATPCGAVGHSAVPTNTPSRCFIYSGRFHRADKCLQSTVSLSVNTRPCWVWPSGF